jgi:hypothetical protein
MVFGLKEGEKLTEQWGKAILGQIEIVNGEIFMMPDDG